MKKKIAIYGGAFNPPHLGHASVLEALIRLFPCDEIWIMPSADRHDKTISASGDHRIKMWQIMLRNLFPHPQVPLKISTLELERNKNTTTYETKIGLEKTYPDFEFYFVVGSELLNDIKDKWGSGKELFESANFVAILNRQKERSKISPPFTTFIEDVVWFDISSTFIRKLISQKFSGIPYLTPGVAKYILKNNLYKQAA